MTALSKHALGRARQRGLHKSDIEFILRYGTDTKDGAILSRNDAEEIIAAAKKVIHLVERLKNKRVVSDGADVITVFHATRRQQHALLHS